MGCGRVVLLLGVILLGMAWPRALPAQMAEEAEDRQAEQVAGPAEGTAVPEGLLSPPFPLGEIPPPITPPPPPMPSTQELLIDRPGQQLGWFATADMNVVKPHFTSSLNSGVPIVAGSQRPGFGQTVTMPVLNTGVSGEPVAPIFPDSSHLPMARMVWTVLPEIYLGYRFGQGAGSVRIHYTGAVSYGSQVVPSYDLAGSGFLRSHLNLNVADLDYVSSEFIFRPNSPLLRRELYAFFGLRALSIFFDTTAAGQQILDQHITNNTGGLGLHVGWGMRQKLPWHGFSLYSKIDAAGIWTVVRQRFTETEVLSDGSLISGNASTLPRSNGVANLLVEGGLSWAPDWPGRPIRFTLGYLWLRYWNAGHTDTSTADLTLQGVLLRGEWAY